MIISKTCLGTFLFHQERMNEELTVKFVDNVRTRKVDGNL